jgi:probable H4MPT-linked C1 transfer pathway protein
MPEVLGLDIGGAHLKAANTRGSAIQVPFELWKQPSALPDALRSLLARGSPYDTIAATMTGELCDCFSTRNDGVEFILTALRTAANTAPVSVWQTDGRFASTEEARARPGAVASANWLALATFAGRYARTGSALLIDVGSTTTDIVPIADGVPVPRGRTDQERLRSGELLYTGVRRTPVCAVLGSEVVAEVFATTLDAYLLLGETSERSRDCFTADGRPAVKASAHARLARMMGADTCTPEETYSLASRIKQRQIHMICQAIDRVCAALPTRPDVVVLAGSGEFLAAQALAAAAVPTTKPVSLSKVLGQELSQAACAYAVAVLLQESGQGAWQSDR